jgi:pimeloyl-ACP methyl ester carboxylesterase
MLALLLAAFASTTLAQMSGGSASGGASGGAASTNTVEINGAHIYYQVQGQGTPIFLIHGYPLSGNLFARNRATLADTYQVITPDLPGFGKSTAKNDKATIKTYAKDMLGLMDHLGIKKAIIGGMSMGGPIVLEMYREAPQSFLGMILIDTTAAPAPPVETGLWHGFIEQTKKMGTASLVNPLIKNMLTGKTRLNKPKEVTFLSNIIKQASRDGDIAGANALATRPDSRPTLSTIKVPTLILVGVDDPYYPFELSQKMKKAIPNAKLVMLPGAAHAAIYEDAQLANQAILGWANQIK